MSDKLYLGFDFIGFILVLIPLPWHLQAWNAGTCLFMVWTAIGCLIHFINSIVWAGNIELHSAPWCDISTKLIVGLSVALPCASLCINRRLYAIASVSQAHTSKAEKRRTVYIDLAIGVGFPFIVMALHYIVQGHRFDIFEDIGCWPSTFNTPPAYPLVWMWPIVIGLISMTYCVLTLRAFLRRRQEFHELLATNQSMNMSRYFRLMALATTEICMTTPFSIYFIYLNLTTVKVSPWISWSDTKWHFSRIDYIRAFFVNNQPSLRLNFSLNLWLLPTCAFLFFAFFGLAEEARRNYTKYYYFMVKPFGILPPSSHSHKPQITQVKIMVSTYHSPNVSTTSDDDSKWDNIPLKRTSLSNPDFKHIEDGIRHVSFEPPITTKSINEDTISLHSTYATTCQIDGSHHRNTIIVVNPSDQKHDHTSLSGQLPACGPATPTNFSSQSLHPSHVVDRHTTFSDHP